MSTLFTGELSCQAYLDPSGSMREASIRHQQNQWIEFTVTDSLAASSPSSYLAPVLPVEIHCHGIGGADFSDFDSLNLEQVNESARKEGIACVLCIFLSHSKLHQFLSFMQAYADLKRSGKLTHIAGIGLEGPLLSSVGGTPEQGTWVPTKEEWKLIASCSEYGLNYIVLSPDAIWHQTQDTDDFAKNCMHLEWIIATLLDVGIKPALGHFRKRDPQVSAAYTRYIIDLSKRYKYPLFSGTILTDHLFNDMPLNFRHAWRSTRDRARRDEEIKQVQLEQWSLDNLPEKVGAVPAALMQAAYEGWITICLNFDGEHVDLDVCRRVIELIGVDSLIAMTDRIDVDSLGGQQLEQREGSHLWYQRHGAAVAAGSSSIDRQMHNLRSIGVSEVDIWKMVSLLPLRVLGKNFEYATNTIPETCCVIANRQERYYFEDHHLYSHIIP